MLNEWGLYYAITTGITFVAALFVPSRARGLDHIGGSFVAALLIGWFAWIAVICAAVKANRSRTAIGQKP